MKRLSKHRTLCHHCILATLNHHHQPSSQEVLGAEERHHFLSPRHWNCRAGAAGGTGQAGGRGGRQERFKDKEEISDLFH